MQAVENCGVVTWVDEEWPQTDKNALARLWGMHNENSNARIAERIASTKLLKELSDEKKKIEKKYNDMVDDVNKLIKYTKKLAWRPIVPGFGVRRNMTK